jgi:hypothetical protein
VGEVPRLCEFYLGIFLTTEEKARKNLSQGKKILSQVKKNLSQSTVYIFLSIHVVATHNFCVCVTLEYTVARSLDT